MSNDHSFWTLKNMSHDHSWVIGDHFRSQWKKFCAENCILGPKFPIISSKIFQRWVTVCFFLSQEWEKIYWVRISKGNYPKIHISNGQFWWLSRDWLWSAMIGDHLHSLTKSWATITHDHDRWDPKNMSHDHSWSANDREWSPITIRSSYLCVKSNLVMSKK